MKIKQCESPQNIDKFLADQLVESINENPTINLGLPTGGTYTPFYQTSVDRLKQTNTDTSSIKTFNLDRYYNQSIKDHSSFEAFMHRHFFEPLSLEKSQTHFPYFNSDDDYGLYDTIIDDAGGLDIILLGIGVNGHIAFNEPGTPFNSKTHKVALTSSTIETNKSFFNPKEDVPTEAVTMGISTILNAKKVILVAKGFSKANAVYDMMNHRIHESVPSTALRLHENVEVYVDEAAGSLI